MPSAASRWITSNSPTASHSAEARSFVMVSSMYLNNWGLSGRPRGISRGLFDFSRPPQIGIPLWRQSEGRLGPLNVRNGSLADIAATVRVMSAFPLKADIHQRGSHVRLVP